MNDTNLQIPLEDIDDHEVYILNPFFRIRKEDGYAVLHGAHGFGTWRIHLSHAIILAACDGHRTVLDIARLTKHFVESDDENEVISLALVHVKSLIAYMIKTKEEQTGNAPFPTSYPSTAPLLSKTCFDKKFNSFRVKQRHYNLKSFVPTSSDEIATHPFTSIRYRSPMDVNWHLTSNCSTDCKYCYLGRRDVKPLSLERAKQLIEEMSEIEVFAVTPLGGDVLIYPHLVELLGMICDHDFLPLGLSTKSNLSQEMAVELSQYLDIIDELQFSIDTDDNQVAEYMLGVSNYCDRIFDSIDNALQNGLRVAAKAVITPYNVLTIPRLYRKLKRAGVSEIRLAAYGRSGFHHTDDLFLNSECYQWLEQEIKKLHDEFADGSIHIQNGGPSLTAATKDEKKQRWPSRSACTVGRSALMICTDGKVIPCEQMPETEEYFCGDVSYQSIMEVWNGDRLKEMTYGMPREKFAGQPCYDCEEREECHNTMGYCIRDLAAHYGNIYQPPPNCYRHDLPFIRQT